jgi:predicted nuclease with TOPRIM domain
VRTALQHAWAELSEKLSDLVDPAIKYGGGDPKNQELLTEYSDLVAEQESVESELPRVRNGLSALLTHDNLTKEEQDALLASRKRTEELQREVPLLRQRMLAKLRTVIDKLPERKN